MTTAPPQWWRQRMRRFHIETLFYGGTNRRTPQLAVCKECRKGKIRYSEVFIQEFIELRNRGKKMKEIFQFLGFDTACTDPQKLEFI